MKKKSPKKQRALKTDKTSPLPDTAKSKSERKRILRNVIRMCKRMTDGSKEDLYGLEPHIDIQKGMEAFVSRTHWIDRKAVENLDKDNDSEEIIKHYGGGD